MHSTHRVSLFYFPGGTYLTFWTNLWSSLGFGASKRTAGIQLSSPGSGRLTSRSVNADTALQLSAVFACIRLLAETIAGLPLNFYQAQAGGALKRIFEHPLQQLLSKKPNRYQTNVEFFETLVYQLALHGNSYHRIDRNQSGEIISLMPYMTPQVVLKLDDRGDITYQYQTGTGVGVFSEETIWHNKLFGNGVIGLSPLDYARNSIGVAISGEDRVNKMANNNFKPSGILMLDKVLKPEQREQIRKEFANLAEGGDDSLRVLEAGMQYSQISMNPKDVQLLETRRFQIEDIARFFGTPSVLINDTSATTVWGSGIEQIIGGFYKLGLRPYMERIEARVSNHLLPLKERGKIIPAFDLDMLLRGDVKTRYESYKTGISSGIITPNECRLEEGLDTKPGGDQLLVQQQLVPLDKSKGGTKNE